VRAKKLPVALTIAGSDSGGGAGIQADLATFGAFNCFGTSVITAITAQNPQKVAAIQAVEPHIVTAQLNAVCEFFQVRAAKTGMLYNPHIIRAVAAGVQRHKIPFLVVDPVMIASSGGKLLEPHALETLMFQLFSLAAVVTPNKFEAEILTQHNINSLDDQVDAAKALQKRFGVPFVVKGGHGGDKMARDVLAAGKQTKIFAAKLIPNKKTHGTGCMFSAAIAANLAHGKSLPAAVEAAKKYVTAHIRTL
jgi:hydroxymethylpyrimidine/phosphomethylpyrimidine kinase